MRRLPLFLLFALAFGNALATPPTFATIAPTEIGDLLKRLGQETTLHKTRSGNSLHVLQFGNTKAVLRALLCKNGSCRLLRLTSVWEAKGVSLEALNAWNAGHRYARAFRDADGDLQLVADLDLDGGVTDQDAMLFIEVFGDQAADFMQEVR